MYKIGTGVGWDCDILKRWQSFNKKIIRAYSIYEMLIL
jgi:hypothetical protein